MSPYSVHRFVASYGSRGSSGLLKLRDAIRDDKSFAKSIGFRYHDGKPGLIEGLLSRGDRRVGDVIETVWRRGARFDGWNEHFSFDAWAAAAADVFAETPVSLDWFTTRERAQEEVLPWDHLDSGLDREWLWDDWQAALAEHGLEDCRWTPCYDCGVCTGYGIEHVVVPNADLTKEEHEAAVLEAIGTDVDVVVLAILIYALLGKLADSIARLLERACLAWNPVYARG